MTHYSEKQWRLYSENKVGENQSLVMQQHLLECEHCFDIYLEVIEEKSSRETSGISESFTDDIIKIIKEERHELIRKAKNKRKNLIASYVAASSITLFLMWSGAFQFVMGTFPESKNDLASTGAKRQNTFASGWTDKLTNGTSELVNSIHIKDFSFKNIKLNIKSDGK